MERLRVLIGTLHTLWQNRKSILQDIYYDPHNSKWLLSRAPTVRKWFHLLTMKKLLISLQQRKVYFCFFITVQSNKKWESYVRSAESALFWHFTCLYSMLVSNWFSEARWCSRWLITSPGHLHTISHTRYSRCTVYPSPKHMQELRVRCERGV